jgi:N-methylhydantoinase A/oxoprolinase/acetone carboxylase beta subunit
MGGRFRIGVDVGGTNTDAVILDPNLSSSPNRGVVASYKTRTTSPQATDGIEIAIRAVLEKSKVAKDSIQCLVIGTTHFINAVIESDPKRLVRSPSKAPPCV